jgi:hypothetical protein
VVGVCGFADQLAVTPAGKPLAEYVRVPLKGQPVAALKLTVPEAPCATAIEAGEAVNAKVGGAVTVSVYVAACDPVLSVAFTAIVLAPGEIVEEDVTVTVAVAPGKIDAGVMVPEIPLGAEATSDTAFLAVPVSVTAKVKVAVFPATSVPLVAEGLRIKSTLGLLVEPVLHTLTSPAPSTEPKPVARLYGALAATKPDTPGTLLLPDGVAWNGFLLALSAWYSPGFALPCPLPPLLWTSSAITPAKEGEAADVPAISHSDPFSTMMYPSWDAAVIATSGTARIPFAALMPFNPFCQVGCEKKRLAPPPEDHNPDPPFDALSFHTSSGM